MIGTLLQENDQDNKSIAALMKAHEVDPQCSETLFQLGVSCTNVLDEITSMMYLQDWLLVERPLIAGNPLVSKERLAIDDYSAEEILAINQILLERFDHAMNTGPQDSKLLMAAGVLHFIGRHYKEAVECFQRSLHLDPKNYSGWNKFGAALAHQGHKDLSKNAYNKALDLKPNYMRSWVNLGLNHSNDVNSLFLIFRATTRPL